MVAVRMPAPFRLLVDYENLRAPAVPILAADGLEVVEHGDALHGPEEIEVLHGRLYGIRGRPPDIVAERLEAILDGGIFVGVAAGDLGAVVLGQGRRAAA